jgi:tetratricopeptide (TPR) repeat protein
VHVLGARVERLAVDLGTEPAHAELATWTERLEETTDALGDDHPLTIRIHDALGSIYARAADDGNATKHWKASLRVSRQTLGDGHPTVATAELKLGRFLREVGELEEAEAVLRRALETFAAHHGPNDVRTLESRNELAPLFARAGDPSRARALDETTARATADDELARAQIAIAQARLTQPRQR